MGDIEKSEFYGLWSEFLNIPKTIKLNPLVISEEISRLMFERIAEKSSPYHVFMEGDFKSRFDNVIDVINDARLNGLIPIEICAAEDNEIDPFLFEPIDIRERKTVLQQRDFVVTIRFRKQ